MDNSLKTISSQLNDRIVQLIAEEKETLIQLENDIKELNIALQGKEMQVDRSENADFQIAKDKRDVKVALSNLHIQRIESMSSEIGEYASTGFITLGSTVELTLIAVDGQTPSLEENTFIFKLVQHHTSNALQQLVAIDSKVGASLLGRTSGEIVDVEAPMGRLTYRIERIY